MHLIGVAKIVPPAWEPDQGWRVLDADGHLVEAGPRSFARMAGDLAGMLGMDPGELRLQQEIARQERK